MALTRLKAWVALEPAQSGLAILTVVLLIVFAVVVAMANTRTAPHQVPGVVTSMHLAETEAGSFPFLHIDTPAGAFGQQVPRTSTCHVGSGVNVLVSDGWLWRSRSISPTTPCLSGSTP